MGQRIDRVFLNRVVGNIGPRECLKVHCDQRIGNVVQFCFRVGGSGLQVTGHGQFHGSGNLIAAVSGVDEDGGGSRSDTGCAIHVQSGAAALSERGTDGCERGVEGLAGEVDPVVVEIGSDFLQR